MVSEAAPDHGSTGMPINLPVSLPKQPYSLFDLPARALWMLPYGPPSPKARGDIVFGAVLVVGVATWEVANWGQLIRQSLPPVEASVAMVSVFLATLVLERDIFMQGVGTGVCSWLKALARVGLIVAAGLATAEPLKHRWHGGDIDRFSRREAALGLVARGFRDLEKDEQKKTDIGVGATATAQAIDRALEAQAKAEARRRLVEEALGKLEHEAEEAAEAARKLDSEARAAENAVDEDTRARAYGLRSKAREQHQKVRDLEPSIKSKRAERIGAAEDVEIAKRKLEAAKGAETVVSRAQEDADKRIQEASAAVLDYLELSVHDPAASLRLGGRVYPTPRPPLTYTDRVRIMAALERGEGPGWPVDTPAELRDAMEKKLRVVPARPSPDLAGAVRWQGIASHILAMLIPLTVLLIKLFGGLPEAKAYYANGGSPQGPRAPAPREPPASSGGGWIRPPAPKGPRTMGGAP